MQRRANTVIIVCYAIGNDLVMIGNKVCRLVCWLLAFVFLPIAVFARTRPKVALVLGGGGAKGAAEVGVLKEIERSGVPIDYIVGTSIGSIVGGLYSIGYRSQEMDSLFCTQNWLQLIGDIYSSNYKQAEYVRGFGLVKGSAVMELLESLVAKQLGKKRCLDSLDFNTLSIPFRAVAADVVRGKAVALSYGNMALAMRASMAIPGLFKPVKVDSLILLDGGLVNNLPVDVARSMGADYVIAIDLTQNKHPDFKPKKIRKNMPRGMMWLRSRPDFVNYNRNRLDCDVYINPTLEGYGVTSFKKKSIRAMIDIGERAGKEKRKELEKLRKKVVGK